MKRLAVGLAALLLCHAAWACSCLPRQEAGFIHADLKRLPANARGALFLGLDTQPQASAFLIVSDAEPGRLKAELTWPVLGDKGKAQRHLARVGPVGGFKPGAHYTIRYMNSKEQWRYPVQVDFFIDKEPLHLEGGSPQLVLDGLPARHLLELSTNSGMCSSQQPAAVQRFHYALPAAYLPYASAVYYNTDFDGDLVPRYFGGLCGDRPPGTTALGGTREIVYGSCEAPKGRVNIQGWAGLLEVEDRVRPTNIVSTDLSAAQGKSCTAFGILKEALATQDQQRISNAACDISGAEYYARNAGLPEDSPTAREMLDFARSSGATPRTCVLAAMTSVLTHIQEGAEELGQGLGQMLASELASTDPARKDAALAQLDASAQYILLNGWRAGREAERVRALIEPALPALMKLLIGAHPSPTISLGALIGHGGDRAGRYIPELLAAAESSATASSEAIVALSAIAPNDMRVQALQRAIKPVTLDGTPP